MKLEENFSLSEFKCKDGTQVPEELMDNVKLLAKNLQISFLSETGLQTSSFCSIVEDLSSAAIDDFAVFNKFVTSTVAPGQLRPIIKKGDNPVVNKAEKAHKECMAELGGLFEKSEKFKIAFAREAMSGYEKYGRASNSAAEFMVVANHAGTKVKIESVDKMLKFLGMIPDCINIKSPCSISFMPKRERYCKHSLKILATGPS